ncbi:MAG: hypothetical protein GY786_10585 [Proteobacteria bacterium]|nr:hypothetical protein [Pseudomonadota bacterium]
MMHPLDQSIVFDGAWRLLTGQWFFSGFTTPVGFVPIVLQAGVFKLVDVSWTSYCLHAAFFNGLFAVMTYVVMRSVLLPRWFSIIIALASGVVFYPPMGTPYMDQHAFFFLFMGLIAAYSLSSKTNKSGFWIASLVAPIFVLGFLSKHVPTAFALPGVVLLVLLGVSVKDSGKKLLGLFLGALASVAIILWFFPSNILFGPEFKRIVYDLPSAIGDQRMEVMAIEGMGSIRALYLKPFQVLARHNTLNSIVLFLPLITLIIASVMGKLKNMGWKNLQADLSLIILIWSFHLSSSIFLRVTSNQVENAIPYCFLVVGLCVGWFTRSSVPKKLFGSWYPKFQKAFLVALILIGSNVVYDAYAFNNRVNETRMVQDTPSDQIEHTQPMIKGLGLNGLEYGGPYLSANLRPDSLILFLNQNPSDRFFLFGDMNFIYALANRQSISPVLWFHSGLTIPDTSTTEFQDFARYLAHQVSSAKPRFVIFENYKRSTYTHLRFSQLPELNKWFDKHNLGMEKVGGFDVFEMKETSINFE